MTPDAKRGQPCTATLAQNHIEDTSTAPTVPAGARALTRSWRRNCETAADAAFATGQLVPLHRLGLVVVPDVVLLEGAAQGHDVPATATLRRADGREARIYRLPEREGGFPRAAG